MNTEGNVLRSPDEGECLRILRKWLIDANTDAATEYLGIASIRQDRYSKDTVLVFTQYYPDACETPLRSLWVFGYRVSLQWRCMEA